MVIVVTENPKNYYFIQVKPLFLVVEFSNTVTQSLEEMFVLKSY